jgi:hypothetical protein
MSKFIQLILIISGIVNRSKKKREKEEKKKEVRQCF